MKQPRFTPRSLLSVLVCGAAALALGQAMLPAWRLNAEPASGPRDFPIRNEIDKLILARLQEEKIPPAAACPDDEFMRRVYLDICGVIPSRDAVKAFLADRGADKRAKLIDGLLKNERYADHWSVMWSDLLREHSNARPKEGTQRGSYREWIQSALAKNMPYDQFTRELLCATGSADENGAVNFFLRDENDRVETVNTAAAAFMGTRMACAQCHDHPFDKWTQNDFHSLMSYFGRTAVTPDPVATLLKIESDKRLPDEVRTVFEPHFKEAHEARKIEEQALKLGKEKDMGAGGGMGTEMSMNMLGMKGKGKDLLKEVEGALSKEQAQRVRNIIQQNLIRQVGERRAGEYRMPADPDADNKKKRAAGDVVPPAFPWDESKAAPSGGSRRTALADAIVTSRQFAAVQVNRLWAQAMGKGIVTPIDDFREKNPPSHPELLNFLTDEFVRSKFDNQHILRLIFNSSTYQRSSLPNDSNRRDTTLFSHRRLRRMTSEQLFDSILVATGRENGLESLNLFDRSTIGGGLGGGRARGEKEEPIQWAVDLPTPSRTGTFMNTFNQPTREQIVVERDEQGSIPQALELLNGRALNDAIRNSPLLKKLLDAKLNAGQIVAELYMAVLSRNPTPKELNYTTSLMKNGNPTREWAEDVYWALLNSREFTFIK